MMRCSSRLLYLNGGWLLPKVLWQLRYSSRIAEVLGTAFISVNRYWAIKHPASYRQVQVVLQLSRLLYRGVKFICRKTSNQPNGGITVVLEWVILRVGN